MRTSKYSREAFRGAGGLNRFLRDLETDIAELHRRQDLSLKEKSSTQTIRISTGGTKVHHGLGRKPTNVRILPKGDARIWETGRDNRAVYLKSSADVDAEVEVRG